MVQEQLVVVVSSWRLDLGFDLLPRSFEAFVSLKGIAVEPHCHPVVPACELVNSTSEGSTQPHQSAYAVVYLNIIKAALVSWIPFQVEGLQGELQHISNGCCQNGLCFSVVPVVVWVIRRPHKVSVCFNLML